MTIINNCFLYKKESDNSKKDFKKYLKAIVTVFVIMILGVMINNIKDLIEEGIISKALFYIGISIILTPMYFKFVYNKPGENLYYGIRALGLLFIVASGIVFFKPLFWLI